MGTQLPQDASVGGEASLKRTVLQEVVGPNQKHEGRQDLLPAPFVSFVKR